MALGLFLALCSHRLSCYHSIFDCFVLIAPLDFVLLAELHLDFVPIAVHPIVIVDLVAPKTRPCLQISKKYEKVRYEKRCLENTYRVQQHHSLIHYFQMVCHEAEIIVEFVDEVINF